MVDSPKNTLLCKVKAIWQTFATNYPKMSRWIANWNWVGLMLAGVAFEEAHEYFIALILLIAGAISVAFATFHWKGIKDMPRLTKISRIAIFIIGVTLLPVSIIWLLNAKGDNPWSRLPSPKSNAIPEIKKFYPAFQGGIYLESPIIASSDIVNICKNESWENFGIRISVLDIKNEGAPPIVYGIVDTIKGGQPNKFTAVEGGTCMEYSNNLAIWVKHVLTDSKCAQFQVIMPQNISTPSCKIRTAPPKSEQQKPLQGKIPSEKKDTSVRSIEICSKFTPEVQAQCINAILLSYGKISPDQFLKNTHIGNDATAYVTGSEVRTQSGQVQPRTSPGKFIELYLNDAIKLEDSLNATVKDSYDATITRPIKK